MKFLNLAPIKILVDTHNTSFLNVNLLHMYVLFFSERIVNI